MMMMMTSGGQNVHLIETIYETCTTGLKRDAFTDTKTLSFPSDRGQVVAVGCSRKQSHPYAASWKILRPRYSSYMISPSHEDQHHCNLVVVFIFTFAAVFTNRPFADASSPYHVMATVAIHMCAIVLKVLNTGSRSISFQLKDPRSNYQEEIKVPKVHEVTGCSSPTYRFSDLAQAYPQYTGYAETSEARPYICLANSLRLCSPTTPDSGATHLLKLYYISDSLSHTKDKAATQFFSEIEHGSRRGLSNHCQPFEYKSRLSANLADLVPMILVFIIPFPVSNAHAATSAECDPQSHLPASHAMNVGPEAHSLTPSSEESPRIVPPEIVAKRTGNPPRTAALPVPRSGAVNNSMNPPPEQRILQASEHITANVGADVPRRRKSALEYNNDHPYVLRSEMSQHLDAIRAGEPSPLLDFAHAARLKKAPGRTTDFSETVFYGQKFSAAFTNTPEQRQSLQPPRSNFVVEGYLDTGGHVVVERPRPEQQASIDAQLYGRNGYPRRSPEQVQRNSRASRRSGNSRHQTRRTQSRAKSSTDDQRSNFQEGPDEHDMTGLRGGSGGKEQAHAQSWLCHRLGQRRELTTSENSESGRSCKGSEDDSWYIASSQRGGTGSPSALRDHERLSPTLFWLAGGRGRPITTADWKSQKPEKRIGGLLGMALYGLDAGSEYRKHKNTRYSGSGASTLRNMPVMPKANKSVKREKAASVKSSKTHSRSSISSNRSTKSQNSQSPKLNKSATSASGVQREALLDPISEEAATATPAPAADPNPTGAAAAGDQPADIPEQNAPPLEDAQREAEGADLPGEALAPTEDESAGRAAAEGSGRANI
ncbi:hypothetical protein G6011_09072 [Alternaria panax]|uniref:Uncharacterized protein n=1 Tax=Alternaria panax TaxID=48097 RepID=A0AAD4IAD8_9PLEO|nr:hypothetical protein G6011_09072 [Alternaria panax]